MIRRLIIIYFSYFNDTRGNERDCIVCTDRKTSRLCYESQVSVMKVICLGICFEWYRMIKNLNVYVSSNIHIL